MQFDEAPVINRLKDVRNRIKAIRKLLNEAESKSHLQKKESYFTNHPSQNRFNHTQNHKNELYDSYKYDYDYYSNTSIYDNSESNPYSTNKSSQQYNHKQIIENQPKYEKQYSRSSKTDGSDIDDESFPSSDSESEDNEINFNVDDSSFGKSRREKKRIFQLNFEQNLQNSQSQNETSTIYCPCCQYKIHRNEFNNPKRKTDYVPTSKHLQSKKRLCQIDTFSVDYSVDTMSLINKYDHSNSFEEERKHKKHVESFCDLDHSSDLDDLFQLSEFDGVLSSDDQYDFDIDDLLHEFSLDDVPQNPVHKNKSHKMNESLSSSCSILSSLLEEMSNDEKKYLKEQKTKKSSRNQSEGNDNQTEMEIPDKPTVLIKKKKDIKPTEIDDDILKNDNQIGDLDNDELDELIDEDENEPKSENEQ